MERSYIKLWRENTKWLDPTLIFDYSVKIVLQLVEIIENIILVLMAN